ncbi:hypothetical protein FNV43_RR23023 [Rhamnella rubrinervis]|uniref:Uncharacterized protein n=1 Tax=Rhamnella rubrinervis TaxID=2594499 RepID=A0A8K0DWC5_9ROSA|nr:hypothetical protein FNV43_RR23023 [Rhamnella rubrinervis]
MSRCFPFPPPGYEKKPTIDDTDLLTKEKNKEKKHKKDKKDREKREGKEKKDRDRSKENNGERKDRKEKHKDKGRNGDKGKNQTSNETGVERQLECNNGKKIDPGGSHNAEIEDSKYVEELDHRLKIEDRATGSQVLQKITVTDAKRTESHNQSEERERTKDKKEYHSKVNIQRNHVEEKQSANSVHNFFSKEQRRLEGVDRAIGRQISQKIIITDTRRPELHNQSEKRERTKDKKEYHAVVDIQRDHVEERRSANSVLNFSSEEQRRLEGVAKPFDRDVGKHMEGRDENKYKEHGRKGHKHKDKDQEKKRKAKDKEKSKEKKKKEKVKERDKLGIEQPKQVGGEEESTDACFFKSSDHLQLNSKNSSVGGNLGKRKELERNGNTHDNGVLPQKLPRPSFSHPVLENGRKLEAIHERQGTASKFDVDIKEHRKMSEPSVKPPHPDAKYLSRILCVPKMVEWSDNDDQEWLFNSNCLESKNPKVASSSGSEGSHEVWAETLQMVSADMLALPYVIPY